MKIARNSSTGKFTTTSRAVRHPKTTVVETIRNERTGEELLLKGYGSMKGKVTVKKGVDLSKPIAAQVLNGKRAS